MLQSTGPKESDVTEQLNNSNKRSSKKRRSNLNICVQNIFSFKCLQISFWQEGVKKKYRSKKTYQ